MWFKSIAQATICSDVDNSPLNFSALVDSVRYGNFFQSLPPTFSTSDESKKRPGLPKLDNDETKRPRDNTRRDITNPNPIQEFKLLPGETWITNFARKSDGRVKWDPDTFMCPRWFITGRCFIDCNAEKSHVTKEDIPNEKLTAFKEFLKKCRAK